MGRSLFHLQRVGQAAMIVARIGNAADDGDGNLLNVESAVQSIHGTDQTGGVAAGQLQVVGANALFIVGVAMEEHISNGVLLAALEDGLHAQLLIQHLVLGADAAGSGIQHDVNGLAQILEGTCNRDALLVESSLVSAVDQIQVVLDVVRADHVVLGQCTDGKGGSQISDADQFHIALHCNAVCQTLTDGTITGNANTNLLSHCNLLQFKIFQ